MKKILYIIDRFFFEKISAKGFGLMRIAWASVILGSLLGSSQDIVRYYSDAGTLPHTLGGAVFRNIYRFTLLDTLTDPISVMLLWSTFVLCLLCTALGFKTRISTILSVILLASFHERNPQILNAGDNLLRAIGFILAISPSIDAFSLDRLRKKQTVPVTMSIWPYRLLLWQLIIIYLASVWEKLHAPEWINGSAIADIFHQTEYFRFSKIVADLLSTLSPALSWSWLAFELSWALLLIPTCVWNLLPERFQPRLLKRWILIVGVFFHAGIMIFMDIGAFSLVMMTGYLGLLLKEDFEGLQKFHSL